MLGNGSENNCLHLAILNKNPSIVKLLIDKYPQLLSRKNAKNKLPIDLCEECDDTNNNNNIDS